MKNTTLFFILQLSLNLYSQNLSEINSVLNLTDSLTYETEVRIYQVDGITNHSSLFRIFKDKSEKWIGEFYKHYAKVDGQTELRIEQQTLKSKNDIEFVFQNFIRSHIMNLPSLSEIQWKLVTRGNVEKIKNIQKGKEIEQYELTNKQVAIIDGEGFKVQAKGWNKINKFEFPNPYKYLSHYPEIDELIYMCEILNIIRTEFGIWKK